MHIVAIYVLPAIVINIIVIMLRVDFDSVHTPFVSFLKYTFCMIILIVEL